MSPRSRSNNLLLVAHEAPPAAQHGAEIAAALPKDCRQLRGPGCGAGGGAAGRGAAGGGQAIVGKIGACVQMSRAYLAWLRESGVELNGVELHTFADGTGRGVVATRALARGETLVSVPDELVLLADSGVAGEALGEAELTGSAVAPRAQREALDLALCAELRAGDRSAYAPYLATLPSREALHVPCCWRSDELRALQGTVCLRRLRSLSGSDELPCATRAAWRDLGVPLADAAPQLGLEGGGAVRHRGQRGGKAA